MTKKENAELYIETADLPEYISNSKYYPKVIVMLMTRNNKIMSAVLTVERAEDLADELNQHSLDVRRLLDNNEDS